MSTTHKRPRTRTKANGKESTGTQNNSYSHASRGFAHWLEVAPPNASFADVATAFKQYDDPHEAWDCGQNHRLTDFGGEADV